MNQSKLKVFTYSWCKAQQHVCKLVTISFGFTSDWLETLHKCFRPTMWCSIKCSYFLTLEWKQPYYTCSITIQLLTADLQYTGSPKICMSFNIGSFVGTSWAFQQKIPIWNTCMVFGKRLFTGTRWSIFLDFRQINHFRLCW